MNNLRLLVILLCTTTSLWMTAHEGIIGMGETMATIGFALATLYLSWFYFTLDYGIEKEDLLLPLLLRGAASVIISIVFLTSIVQSGLPFQVFPQALTINGFTGAVMGVCFGPAILGEWLYHTMAKNFSLLSGVLTNVNTDAINLPMSQLHGMVQKQALVVSMKEIYGWLLLISIISTIGILLHRGNLRPFAFFPKWSKIRRIIWNSVRTTLSNKTINVE